MKNLNIFYLNDEYCVIDKDRKNILLKPIIELRIYLNILSILKIKI